MLKNGMRTLRTFCVDGITANKEYCLSTVHNSIGLVTALSPVLGYETCGDLAKKALETGDSIYNLVLQDQLLTQEQLDEILAPGKLTQPQLES